MPAPAAAPAPTAATTDAAPAVPVEVDTRWRVDGMLGLGSDNLNVGLGARFGKTLANHIYLGGLFVYHVGDSVTTTTGSASMHGFYTGPEAGYDISLAPLLPVTIRPYLGLGFGSAFGSSTTTTGTTSMTTSGSSSQLSVWPGFAAFYRFADTNYVVGGDMRIVTGPWNTSFGMFVVAGTYFGS
jgi:hypothetical protein